MENELFIERQLNGDQVVLIVRGRIDSYWSEHLSNAIKEEINNGIYNIALNLTDVYFISSIGIRIFMQFYRQLNGLGGAFILTGLSENVANVLKMSGLLDFFIKKDSIDSPKSAKQTVTKHDVEVFKPVDIFKNNQKLSDSVNFYHRYINKDTKLKLSLIGKPGKTPSYNYSAQDITVKKINDDTYLIGLGSLGSSVDDCLERLGECIGICGAAIYHPTDGTNKPDFALSAGNFIPELFMGYGLGFEGKFESLYKFEAKDKSNGIKFNELISSIMDNNISETTGFAIVAQASGIVGATLAKPPNVIKEEDKLFNYPEIIDNITFTAERIWPRSLVVISGIASKKSNTNENLKSLLKPMKKDSEINWHFHASVFPFHPLKKDIIEIKDIIHSLLNNAMPVSVMHLLNDEREIVGAGDSELTQGYCWVGSIIDN